MADAGFVYREVLTSGRTTVIGNPGHHALCRRCPKFGACEEKMELCTPISQGGTIIGVIGIICTTALQHAHLASRLEAHCRFLEQVAGFIAGKAFEYEERQRRDGVIRMLDQVVDNMGRGVIILGRDATVVHANRLAREILGDGLLGQKVLVKSTGDVIEDLEEVRLTVRGQTTPVMSQVIPVTPGLADYERIIVFSDIPTLSQAISRLKGPGTVTTETLLGRSEAMRGLRRDILMVAQARSSVLITGESGTGKELVAKSIHAASPRAKAPFVAINCAAIPDTLLESELFGHVRGAFTGADPKGRIGKFELANGGTLFLDEIGDMPLYLQAKLLRVLEDFTITRIGSNQVVAVDVRILSATNQDLPARIRAGRFREDLYYRLHVVPLAIPPLRDRPEDIEDIALALVQSHARALGREPPPIRPDLMRRLLAHRWPGNVRELGNVVEFMLTMLGLGEDLSLEALPPTWRELPEGTAMAEGALKAGERRGERQAIALALAVSGTGVDGKRRAAARLGISLATLYRKLHLLGMAEDARASRR
jgi:transcriptional regulator with PAS, ATPase and Fis domain